MLLHIGLGWFWQISCTARESRVEGQISWFLMILLTSMLQTAAPSSPEVKADAQREESERPHYACDHPNVSRFG